jgi:hypothetical protein
MRSGVLDEVTPPAKPKHMVSDVDQVARTGVCSICGPVKVRYKAHRNYYECGTLGERYRKAYKPKAAGRDARRRWRLKSKYGITPDHYDRMYEIAGGRCEICRTSLPLLHIDHDHDTGEVRGLLCSPCNIALGNFKDSPENIVSALRYLSRTNRASGVVV